MTPLLPPAYDLVIKPHGGALSALGKRREDVTALVRPYAAGGV